MITAAFVYICVVVTLCLSWLVYLGNVGAPAPQLERLRLDLLQKEKDAAASYDVLIRTFKDVEESQKDFREKVEALVGTTKVEERKARSSAVIDGLRDLIRKERTEHADKIHEMSVNNSDLLTRLGVTLKQLRAVQDMYKKLDEEREAVTREMNSARFALSALQKVHDEALARLDAAESGAPALSELEKKIVNAALNASPNRTRAGSIAWSGTIDHLWALCAQYEREKRS